MRDRLASRRLSPQPDSILVVCTGNICRSPYIAERLMPELPRFMINSAGTGAVKGADMATLVRELLAQRDVYPASHEARAITRSMIRSSALVLTATRRHRVEVIALDKTAADRTFTLKELARSAIYLPRGAGLEALVGVAQRQAENESTDHDDDLADPWGREHNAYELMAREAEEALTILLPVLRSRPRP